MNATEQLASYLRETRLLGTSMRLLEWDQETLMPAAATPLRAEQLALLTGLLHERNTSDELGELIDRAEDGPMAREARYDYERQTKIPADLAKERSLKTALSRQAWIESRKADDFAHFQPHLEQQVELMIRWADAIGYESDPYDALVGDYEPGETVATMDELLAPLREMSADLLARILDSGVQMDGSFIRRPYPVEKQEQLGRMVAAAFGFDFDRGRLDVTAHPFCSGMFPTDVRLTTRYEEGYMADALYSTLHEAGHGMYEQGLPEDQFGNPLGDASGMAMHE
ncbi:MAG: carboxypeptidase M32, partial [Planctomycetota bacterium]